MEVDLEGFERYMERRGSQPKTVQNYLLHVRHPEGYNRLRSKALAPKSKRVVLCAWRAYGRFLKRIGENEESDELLSELEEIKLPAPMRERPQIPLPREFFDDLREKFDTDELLDDPTRGALGIMANRGLRRIDILCVQPKEIRTALKQGVLAFRAKGGRRLEFGVTKNYRHYLEMIYEGTRPGEKNVAQAISKAQNPEKGAGEKVVKHLKRVASTMELADYGVELEDVRCHILRRTYATIFYEACGGDPVKLKDHMQWASIVTATNYVDHSQRTELDEIAEGMFAD